MTQKTLISIILLITFIGGGALYIFFSNFPVRVPSVILDSEVTSLEYINPEYQFVFSLPTSWQGYVIVTSTWQGISTSDDKAESTMFASGTIISIRHPLWTKETPRQDIPIMVFTLLQWSDLLEEKFHIGAAPIGPSELARNTKYVFALPARYNFAFPIGFEEVEQILSLKPLQIL